MKAIEVRYLGPTNTRGSRYVADDGDGNRLIMSAHSALSPEDNAREAARRLCAKMGWTGRLIEGYTKSGRVYVWSQGASFDVR